MVQTSIFYYKQFRSDYSFLQLTIHVCSPFRDAGKSFQVIIVFEIRKYVYLFSEFKLILRPYCVIFLKFFGPAFNIKILFPKLLVSYRFIKKAENRSYLNRHPVQ